MDFILTEEQQLMQSMFREFAQTTLKPMAAELDETEHFPAELIPQMGEIGLFGIPSPTSTAARAWAIWSTPWPWRS